MPSSTRNPKKLRYRLYFWLMDACLLFAVIGFVDFLLDKLFDVRFDVENPVYFTIGVTTILFNFFVAAFLLLAAFMRDEYAEGLFRQSVVYLAYAVIVGPMIISAAAWVTYWLTGTPGRDSIFRFLYAQGDILGAFFQLLFYYLLLFVAIFQFNRWRASR